MFDRQCDATRPLPDAPLHNMAGESKGRLKIFLGAAPGVGKTYEMLEDGAERLDSGVDVVAGIIETHGRPETEAMLARFEIVPCHSLYHRGQALTEMDLDAVIARRPALVMIDELAHRNVEGSRHPERWQDVLELIDAGIDVSTTLNVQHIESLSDVVASFTRVRVEETVPDGILEHAEIKLIDLPPDELIARLEQGKVHVSDEVSRVLGHYFSKPNLYALRETAMRRAAESVDRQMLEYLDTHALPGTFAAGERVLVAVSEQAGADRLVRVSKRLADALRANWTAVYIETSRAESFDETQKRRIADALRLAASLGATIATVPAETVMEGLRSQVEGMRATQLVIGKSRRSWWFALRHGSVVDAMLRMSDGLAVHVIPAQQAARAGRSEHTAASVARHAGWGSASDYAIIAALIAGTTLIARLAEPWIGSNAIDLVFLLPVILSAALYGLKPGIVTGVIAAFTYNFFFLSPRYTFSVADPQAVIALFVLVGIAGFTSRLTGKLKTRATLGLRSAQENAAVAAFAQTLARVSDRGSTAAAICEEVSRLLDVHTIVLGMHDGRLEIVAARPEGATLGPVDQAAAEWAAARGEQAGKGTASLNAADWLFAPLKTSLGTLAVLGVAREDGGEPIPADRAVLLSALVGQAALAHERLHLEDDMRDVSVLKERDRLRMALLSAIGNDLRVPLGAVKASIEAAAAEDPGSAPLGQARREVHRLMRFLGDLANMVKIDSGDLAIETEPIDLVDAVSVAAHDVHDLLRDMRIDLQVPARLPQVIADPRLLRHMLSGLLADAAQQGGDRRVIVVEGQRAPDAVLLTVRGLSGGDNGEMPALPTGLPGGDRPGGFGLAIVRAFAVAMDIEVSVGSTADGGASYTLRFGDQLIRTAIPQDTQGKQRMR